LRFLAEEEETDKIKNCGKSWRRRQQQQLLLLLLQLQ
jgi:hypothetical protein